MFLPGLRRYFHGQAYWPSALRRFAILPGALLLSAGWTAPNAEAQITAVVDAASYSSAIAPGGLITIFGMNLASEPRSASGLPLPMELGGVVATFSGSPIPLLYVSATQINAQLPFDAEGTGTLRVTTQAGSSQVNISIARRAPAIFRVPGPNGAFPTITHADGTSVSPASPARPGEIITIYLTGLGEVGRPILPGHAAPSSPIPTTGAMAG